jgi:rSAM/selenodomain-associated transferase 2
VISISVIVPTYNEQETIGSLLDNLAHVGPDEIIVVDGGSTDGTLAPVDGGVRLLQTALGRAVQMNAGASAACGDVLLFLHADARLRPTGLNAIRDAMRDSAVLGGNFDIRYEGKDTAAALFTQINRQRRRWGILYGDSGIFCRRDVFKALGAYRPWPILEDYEFARRLWKAGALALLDEPIYVSDRRWRNSGVFPTLWSWFWVQALYLAGVSPYRLAKLYRHVR